MYYHYKSYVITSWLVVVVEGRIFVIVLFHTIYLNIRIYQIDLTRKQAYNGTGSKTKTSLTIVGEIIIFPYHPLNLSKQTIRYNNKKTRSTFFPRFIKFGKGSIKLHGSRSKIMTLNRTDQDISNVARLVIIEKKYVFACFLGEEGTLDVLFSLVMMMLFVLHCC